MRIYLLISILFSIAFATSLNAQTSNHSHGNNQSLRGDVPAIDMPTGSTSPRIVYYSHLPNGLYFMFVIDNSSKELLFLKTFRKGIK